MNGKEKTIMLLVFFVVVIVFQTNAIALWIDNVEVTPTQPLDTDIITFNIDGRAGGSPSWVEYDEFYQDETSLCLDVYIDAGMLSAVSFWTHSREISPLAADDYTL